MLEADFDGNHPLFQVLNLMLEADLDGNGTIEFPEFLELMKEKYGTDDQEADLRSVHCSV